MAPELSQLRLAKPLWRIGTGGGDASTGPASFTLWAERGSIFIQADSVPALREQIERMEAANGWDGRAKGTSS